MEAYNYTDIQCPPPESSEIELCRILYSEDYLTNMGYMRGIMSKNEYSERALALTEKIINVCAAHYTVWEYRYNIIKDGSNHNKIIKDELIWSENIILENPKNYQVWHYRQLLIIELVSKSSDDYNVEKEFELIDKSLIEDSKNYHSWTYRTWLTKHFKLYNDKNLSFINSLLKSDIRNNSAWNFRFFLLVNNPENYIEQDRKSIINGLVLQKELKFTENAIELAPQNQSSWNYLIGIYEKFNLDINNLKGLSLKYSNFEDDKISELEMQPIISSVHALELLARIYSSSKTTVDKAIRAYDLLATKYDPIRVNYWKYLSSSLNTT
ncbi:bifunctional protein farnesyltransferase/protein geranylgeranyltransferase [Ascoidea rubescens DSM 1968]|uniref:Protein farnesyltransferase/geranylgeranyltransferase type-1 subunit alpha n=1 Tax=Ascoidea rubescens DSM 1968 TaxID=1344418 RepID=A0A1D2VAW1_9ASCO|nr:protein farnesyltransferase [Ascoidea rubescens DSM 1968]ODV58834.1 protein farnesyltransferase [Ascoidea rubescens DSM 1968]